LDRADFIKNRLIQADIDNIQAEETKKSLLCKEGMKLQKIKNFLKSGTIYCI
jgi:hypothetical protein